MPNIVRSYWYLLNSCSRISHFFGSMMSTFSKPYFTFFHQAYCDLCLEIKQRKDICLVPICITTGIPIDQSCLNYCHIHNIHLKTIIECCLFLTCNIDNQTEHNVSRSSYNQFYFTRQNFTEVSFKVMNHSSNRTTHTLFKLLGLYCYRYIFISHLVITSINSPVTTAFGI